VRNPGGYAKSFDDRGIGLECDTFTCFHCNTVVHVNPKCHPDELGGMCRLCMKMICPACVDLPCLPFEKKLEIMEAKDRALRSYGVL
jgi:hypothetical protein